MSLYALSCCWLVRILPYLSRLLTVVLNLTFVFFFLNDPAPPEISTLSLHDALPICEIRRLQADRPERGPLRPGPAVPRGLRPRAQCRRAPTADSERERGPAAERRPHRTCPHRDRKSTRLNSSHGYISYAVFCLKKKK